VEPPRGSLCSRGIIAYFYVFRISIIIIIMYMHIVSVLGLARVGGASFSLAPSFAALVAPRLVGAIARGVISFAVHLFNILFTAVETTACANFSCKMDFRMNGKLQFFMFTDCRRSL
jgi:hypothetical protein